MEGNVIAVSGSRSINDISFVHKVLDKVRQLLDGKFIFGDARGVDAIAKAYMEKHSIPYEVYPAEWEKYGRRAGPIRDWKLAKDCDFLVAIWDGKSRGTKHTIDAAIKQKKPVLIVPYWR